MSERRGVLLVGALVLVAAVVLTIGWAGRSREFVASSPQPSPLFETRFVTVGSGEELCLQDVTAVPGALLAQLRVSINGREPVPLTLRMFGSGGYFALARIPPTYRDDDVLNVPIDGPARPVHARACVRNDGRHAVAFYAAPDASPTLAAEIDRSNVDDNPVLRLLEAERGTIGGHAARIAEQVTVFRPPFVGAWLVWLLALLVVVGLPALVTLALWRALRP